MQQIFHGIHINWLHIRAIRKYQFIKFKSQDSTYLTHKTDLRGTVEQKQGFGLTH